MIRKQIEAAAAARDHREEERRQVEAMAKRQAQLAEAEARKAVEARAEAEKARALAEKARATAEARAKEEQLVLEKREALRARIAETRREDAKRKDLEKRKQEGSAQRSAHDARVKQLVDELSNLSRRIRELEARRGNAHGTRLTAPVAPPTIRKWTPSITLPKHAPKVVIPRPSLGAAIPQVHRSISRSASSIHGKVNNRECVNVNDGKREIRLLNVDGKIQMLVINRSDNSESVQQYHADSLSQLRSRHPDGYALYQRIIRKPNQSGDHHSHDHHGHDHHGDDDHSHGHHHDPAEHSHGHAPKIRVQAKAIELKGDSSAKPQVRIRVQSDKNGGKVQEFGLDLNDLKKHGIQLPGLGNHDDHNHGDHKHGDHSHAPKIRVESKTIDLKSDGSQKPRVRVRVQSKDGSEVEEFDLDLDELKKNGIKLPGQGTLDRRIRVLPLGGISGKREIRVEVEREETHESKAPANKKPTLRKPAAPKKPTPPVLRRTIKLPANVTKMRRTSLKRMLESMKHGQDDETKKLIESWLKQLD